MTTPADHRTDAPPTTGAGVPEKPALEGLEDKWMDALEGRRHVRVRPACHPG